jgi:hypothetical protein
MPRRWVIACGSVACVALLIAYGESPPPSPPPAAQPGNISAQELAACSARGCHGASLPDVKVNELGMTDYGAESRNSATAWLRYDKHARAYAILAEDKAEAIMRLLDRVPPGQPLERHAWQEERCLACHATPTAAHDLAHGGAFVDNGFSCEACHGADSRKYLVAHQTNGAFPPGPNARESYDKYGMTWLNDPQSRAQLCVGCHVGAPADEKRGIPLRDMNHDMIAAGHPRLTFEFASYLRNMPPHWQERDRTKSESQVIVRSPFVDWLAGQQETAKAGLELLETRANRASILLKSPPKAPDWRTTTPWPEFAEYDCYACHRGLSGRTGKDAMQFPTDGEVRGGLVMNRWTWSLPFRRIMSNAGADADSALRELRTELAKNVAAPDKVKYLAARARALVAGLRVKPADVLSGITLPQKAEAKSTTPLRWDEAAHLYHAWAAAYVSRPEALARAEPMLMDLYAKLRFKVGKGENGPADYVPTEVPDALLHLFGQNR